MTKFGRSFSIVRIPYCLKLLMQELIVMNVQMRIITEDNIDQLPSMSYSKNVYKVLKDGKGAMGVDDIIERNRLAAGLKPRDMAAIGRKDATTAETVSGIGSVGLEEEATFGSRVYLPSRSEEEEYAKVGARTVSAAAALDPDERIDEIIPDLGIDTKQSIRNLGWRFALKEEVARELKGNGGNGGNGGNDSVSSEDLVLVSVILDKNGEPTERWTISGRQWTGDYPTRFPDGWLSEMLVYPDDTPISPSDMVEELRNTRKPLNWVTSIISLMDKYSRRKAAKNGPVGAVNVALAENERDIAENERETTRVSGEIERAKREGNVAEEERLKVQLSRMADERTKLDTTRREMERDAAGPILPMTPEFTGSSTPTGEVDADQVRDAVASFNARMIEKYGENDQEIPETSSPRYSSIFEGGGRGGQRGGGDKFIPQIPTSVLDNYLNSKYGVSSKHTTVHIGEMSSAAGLMTGGGVGGGFPTMNIPVVATMPMAGMMPFQQAPQATQATQAAQAAQASQAAQAAQTPQVAGSGLASNTSSSNEPNAQGVKTFSIKL
jgi:hypothetical protein